VAESTVISQLGDQVTGLITKRAIIRVKNMIEKYNGRTDALLLSEGLIQTRKMLLIMKDSDLVWGTVEADLILEEFRIRWLEMDAILKKTRGKRPVPVWTEDDKQQYREIVSLSRAVFKDVLPMRNVVSLLLEANHE